MEAISGSRAGRNVIWIQTKPDENARKCCKDDERPGEADQSRPRFPTARAYVLELKLVRFNRQKYSCNSNTWDDRATYGDRLQLYFICQQEKQTGGDDLEGGRVEEREGRWKTRAGVGKRESKGGGSG